MTSGRQETGRRGEEVAADYLRKAGYRLLTRNFRCPLGELDVVAEHSGCIVIVEVRTRREGSMVRPEDTVNLAKARRVVKAAEHYLSVTGRFEQPWRMDVVAVEVNGRGVPVRIEHYQDALADLTRHL